MGLFRRLHTYLRRYPTQAVMLLLGILTLIGYANTLAAPFVFDDTGVFGERGVILTFTGFLSVWDYFPARVIPYATFLVNYWIGGVNPVGYHLVDMLLHWATAVAVYWLVRLLGARVSSPSLRFMRQRWVAVSVAVIFTIHPLQTETVTYVYQRSTELAALSFILALCFFIRRSWKLSLLSAGVAFFSKENTYMLPVVLFVTLGVFFPREIKKKETIWYLLAVVCFAAVGFYIIGNHTYQDQPAKGVTHLLHHNTQIDTLYGPQYVLTEINVVATYLRLLLFPVGQNIDYDYPLVQSLDQFPVGALVLHLGILAAAVALLRRNKVIFYGIAFFYLTLAVESSFIPLDDVMFEHRLYLPSVGFFLALLSLGAMLVHTIKITKISRIIVPALSIGVVGILLALTIMRNSLWRDPALLWRDSVTKSPKKPRPHYNLAVIYDRNDQLEPALKEYKETLLLQPRRAEALINMGVVLTRMGRLKDAEKAYVLADAVDPQSDALPLLNLGTLYMQENNMDMARLAFEELVKRQPKHPFALYNLGLVYESLERKEEATQMYQNALAAAAGNPAELQVIQERERNRQAWYAYQKAQQQSHQQAPAVVLPTPPQQDQ